MAASDSKKPIIIAGCGIGGLSAAMALGRAGFHVHMVERSDTLAADSGTGIQLGPSATRLLTGWGMEAALRACACEPAGVDIRDGLNGGTLAVYPLGREATRRYGAPYLTLHRPDLHAVLRETAAATPGVTITTGFEVADINSADGGVDVVSTSGARVSGAALAGADGIRSPVRRWLNPHVKEIDDGFSAWRTVLAAESAPDIFASGRIGLWLHPRYHLVHYPVASGRLINVVAVARGENFTAAPPDFHGWPAPVREGLALVADWKRWPLMRLEPLPRWNAGNVTILGDAAHPIFPFLASGGVLAIEDAAVLAQSVAGHPDNFAAAFAVYAERRRERATRVVQKSRAMGGIYHMNGAMRLARNLALPLIPAAILAGWNDWLYSARVVPGA
jgi:salicylate hydroxylase